MASLWSILRGTAGAGEERYGMDQWAQEKVLFGGLTYPLFGGAMYDKRSEATENNFEAYVSQIYKKNGIVYACMAARRLVFSEVRFMWQRLEKGRPGDLWANKDLKLLENPWPNGSTGELLSRALQDSDLAGNHYVAKEGDRLRRLRPDWTEIILTAPPNEAVKSDVAGYLYRPGGSQSKVKPVLFKPEDVAHWSFDPDPVAQYRGMSWLGTALAEIQTDGAATQHKRKFFENAATPNLAVSLKETVTKEQFKEFMEEMNRSHQGVDNAYKTLFLGGGADVRVVGADLRAMDFKQVQGAGETRIAAAARIHPVLVGLSEGMQGSTLNEGNFKSAKDAFGQGFLRPAWSSICSAYKTLVEQPGGSRLWYDDRDIAYLRDDRKVIAEVQKLQTEAIAQLVMQGFVPDSAVAAVLGEDMKLLKHTGRVSVQLLPPDAMDNANQPAQGVKPGQSPSVKPKPAQAAQPANGQPKGQTNGQAKPKVPTKRDEGNDE